MTDSVTLFFFQGTSRHKSSHDELDESGNLLDRIVLLFGMWLQAFEGSEIT